MASFEANNPPLPAVAPLYHPQMVVNNSGHQQFHQQQQQQQHQHPNFVPSRDGAFAPYHRPVARRPMPSQGMSNMMIRPNDGQIIDVDKDEVEPAIAVRPTSNKETAEKAETKASDETIEKIDDSRDDNVKEVVAAASSQDRDRENHSSADTSSSVNLTKRPLDIACTEATMPANHDDPTPRHFNYNKNKRSRIAEGVRSSQLASIPAGDYSSSSDSFEARQDKSQANLGEYENRHSSSASITQGLSWGEYPEPAGLNSKSMSWEVPAGTLSTIGSFGQFNMGNASPQKKMRDSALQGGFAPLPPLPGTEQEDSRKQSHLAPRPIHGMFDPPRPTSSHYAGPGQQDNLRSAHDSYPSAPSHPHYQRGRTGSFTMETRDTSHASPSRPPYEYVDNRTVYPDPSQSASLFPYPNEQPNRNRAGSFEDGLSANRSFQSLEGLEGPENSLMYGKSFSWERGLDMEGGNGQDNHANDDNMLVQLKDQQSILRTLAMRGAIRTIGNPHNSVGLILLLSMPEDRHCLSETLAIIRNNVEVFTATEADINAPAPGRKRPIQLGQVGLRCVYCRMCRTGNRIKRATCFPSSMRRIYRAVIDMKLDHFKHCPYVPPGLKQRLDQLSQGTTRSTGMTVQYFIRSAMELGMMDIGNDGVFINLKRVGKVYDDSEINNYCKPIKVKRAAPHPAPKPRAQARALQVASMPTNEKRFHGKVVLSLPEDENFLSPLRCFLRQQVCVFSATETDIAIRTPTTFTVQLGQVGVGCVHCLAVAPKERSNRAVCFPFSIGRIYQSVADIQRFHLGECRMMPPAARSKFLQLQSESAKGSRGLATRTYWIDAAKKIGLKDGTSGMYFVRDPALPPPVEDKSLDVLAQVQTNFNAAKYPLVGPEDKPTIADFLYRVMEQLQPCRFTDADRNKRRSKNLGSIGVECRHCAGKIDGRKFFWSSVSAAESNFVSVHSHMMECRYIDGNLKTELARLKALRREQTSQLKNGSQKAFFTRVWERLKDIGEKVKAEENMAIQAAANHHFNEAKKGESHEEDLKELQACGSDDINALLQNQSTLSSMPSIENCDSIVKTAIQQLSDEEINLSRSAGDSVVGGASKSSLSSVALNLSAVTMHCKEEKMTAEV
mmetsp:Transcript_21118/g.42281  ORF Transcript_21118/g.42281 Transcript_21118/m.42281 type:complete len:1122 (+) Transcript_21118:118-3483(+)